MSTSDYPKPSFLEESKTGPIYAPFITFERRIISDRPSQPSAGENSGSLGKANQALKVDAAVPGRPRRGRLLDFLLKDAEEMSWKVNLSIADMTASPPKSPSRATVPNYMYYLRSLYFLS